MSSALLLVLVGLGSFLLGVALAWVKLDARCTYLENRDFSRTLQIGQLRRELDESRQRASDMAALAADYREAV